MKLEFECKRTAPTNLALLSLTLLITQLITQLMALTLPSLLRYSLNRMKLIVLAHNHRMFIFTAALQEN